MDQSSEYAIRTFGLTKVNGERAAVNDINLSIKAGEMFSLLGPNGAGKTTTIKMLCCLLKPSSGTAHILDHDIRKNPRAVKQIIDVSPQETAVAGHLNARENLLLMGGVYGMSREETRQRTEELIALTGLTGRTGEQVRKFSGGLQRRLSIAMALVSDPQVLFLDEPTLGLDLQARRTMWKQIEKLKGEKTILLTTHYLEEADALADRIAIMNEGRIIAMGTPGELKQNMYGMQTMVIKAQNLSVEVIAGLRNTYPVVAETESGVEIQAKELIFDEVVDCLRSLGVKIESLTTKEPTLDDVFLQITAEKVRK